MINGATDSGQLLHTETALEAVPEELPAERAPEGAPVEAPTEALVAVPAKALAEVPAGVSASNMSENKTEALREANEALAKMTERKSEARRGWAAASDDAQQLRAALVAERESYAEELAQIARVLKVRFAALSCHMSCPVCPCSVATHRTHRFSSRGDV